MIIYGKLLAAVSTMALLMAAPALAAGNNRDTPKMPEVTPQEIEKGLEDAQKAASETAEDVSEAVQETYKDLKDALDGKSGIEIKEVSINANTTANALLGQPVYNGNNERIGTLKDLIIDSGGQTEMVVVSDAEFLNIGAKIAAFDHDMVIRYDDNNKVSIVMPISEEAIDQAKSFSYNPADRAKENVQVLPADLYSTAMLLEGKLVNDRKEMIADIDNIAFKDGAADTLIVSFNETLDFGGNKAALDFDEPEILKDGENLDFQLSAQQSRQFETYKKNTSASN